MRPRLLSLVGSVILLIGMASMQGCTSSMSEALSPNCTPTPPSPCAPGTFTQVTLDTVFHGMGAVQNHISVVPAPISTNATDFAVTFVTVQGHTIALVTSDRAQYDGSGISDRDRLWAYDAVDGHVIPVRGLDSVASFGAATYSKADAKLYFSAFVGGEDPDDYDLYTASLHWAAGSLELRDIEPLSAVNERNKFDSQPAVDASGTTLIFASDRSGGMGGVDLWISRRSSAHDPWAAPSPISAPVNSECDELSPSFGSDGQLYFASNGHATAGGYDLFASSVQSGGVLGTPRNLGLPINTQYDELFPLLVNDSSMFWSSNRLQGPDNRNIFTITRTGAGRFVAHTVIPSEKPQLAHIDSLPTGPVDFYVDVTGKEGKPAKGAELFVRRDTTEIYRAKAPASGKFKIKLKRDVYDVGAENAESFFDVKHLDLRTEPDSTIHITLNVPDTLVLRINFPFDDYTHPYEFVIDDEGQASTMTWEQALDLTARATVRSLKSLKKLVVIGHTDSLGTDTYNDRLGLHRAEFVAAELVKRGVPKRLISVSSRGRTDPVAIRPGETDEQFRLRSRRVEFVKVF